MKKTSSRIVTIFTKTIRLILTALIIFFCIWFCWVAYDEKFSESARLSKKFNSKVESLSNSGVTSIRLRDITDFEWDVVCIYGEEGEAINLKNSNLVERIGYKPKFLIRSTYYLPYDFSGLLFSNSKTKEIIVLHRLRKEIYDLLNQKSFFYDVEYLGHLKNPDPTSDYYPLNLNRCYKTKESSNANSN